MRLKNTFPIALVLILLLFSTIIFAQRPNKIATKNSDPISAIRESDIKQDIYTMAGDHFRGREAGTLDELKVSVWLAEQARKAGLEPAGDDGTYFQFFSLLRNRISQNSKISVGERVLPLWKEALVTQTASADIDAPLLFFKKDQAFNNSDVNGKAVAVEVSAADLNLPANTHFRRYIGFLARKYASDLFEKGATALVLVADSVIEANWATYASYYDRGTYNVEDGSTRTISSRPPIIWIHHNASDLLKQSGQMLHAHIQMESFTYPSVNVVAKVKGTDPKLSQEYVLFSGHQDHDGVRAPINGDSIYNGADDNASVSVALLAIGRAFHQKPGRRSALFVWHGAEERGLLGSKWYAAHPTVPQSSIVAVLNGDMIGRNALDSAALLGVLPPHRNSSDLVSMALAANDEGPKFKLDYSWDDPAHPEVWYFRSDHLSYARVGIPALFFTTLLHPDYHTPKDEADRIGIKKLTKMTEWIYRTGWKVATTTERPKLEPDFKLER